MNQECFSDVRALLSLPPSQTNFRNIMELLLESEEEHQETLVGYVESHLAAWDDQFRCLSEGDRIVWEYDTNSDVFQLVRSFSFYERWPDQPVVDKILHLPIVRLSLDSLRPKRKKKWKSLGRCLDGFSDEFLGRITSLDVSSNLSPEGEGPPPALLSFLSRDCFDRLVHLNMEYCDLNHDHVLALMETPTFQRIKALTLSNNRLGEEGINVLAQCQFPQLSELNLEDTNMGPSAVGTLGKAPFFRQLTSLRLANNYTLRDEGVSAFVEATKAGPTSLKKLSLLSCGLTDMGVQTLAQAKGIEQLAMLDVGSNDIGDDGFRAIATSPTFSSLRELHLCYTHPGPDGFKELLGSAALSHLERFRCYSCELQDAHLLGIADLPGHLPMLQELDLYNNQIGVDGLTALSQSPLLATVRELDLSNNPFGDTGMEVILSSSYLGPLTSLSAKWAGMTNRGVECIASTAGLSQLTRLDVSGNDVDAEGLRALAESPCMARLQYLHIAQTRLDDRCVEILLEASFARELRCLSINNLTEQSVARLRQCDKFESLEYVQVF